MNKLFRNILVLALCTIGFVSVAHAAMGTIDPGNDGSYKALIQNTDLGAATAINFGKFTTQSAKNITVSDTELRGFAWGEGVGWIVTNCADTTSGCSVTNSNFKIANDGSGNLSGYAWGENTGWINFGPFTNPLISTVKISGGQFGGTLGSAGYAWSQNFGFIKFDCSSPTSCVKTDWAPGGAFQCNDTVDNDGDGLIDYPADPGCSNATDNDESNGGTTGGPGTPACRDGRDNDGDNLVDYPSDPGCDNADDTNEFNAPIDFCTANPSDPSCSFCALNPTNPACQQPPFCTTNPGDPSCSFCNQNPGDPSCQIPFCTTNPTAPICQQPFCTLYPNDPSCQAQPFCTTNPNDPSCAFCVLNPTDPSCKTTPSYCQVHPEECYPPKIPTKIEGATKSFVTGTIGKILKLTGLVAVGVGALALSFVGTQFSLYSLLLLLMRLWSLLLIALGIKKKSNPWGTVYDSVTKQPIDPAYVVLMDMQGNEVATSITDIEGRYGFAVPPGTYTIIANKTNYEFPSKKLAGKTSDELYDDLYFGGPIVITEQDGLITKNIPLDQQNFDWNEYAKNEQHRLRHYKRQDLFIARLSNIFFILGFIVTAISVLVVASLFNIVLMGLYIVTALGRLFKVRIQPKGSVADTATDMPLPFSVVRVVSTATNKEIMHKVAGPTGKYYALVANGDYRVVVDRKNADQSYTPVSIPDPVAVKKGYMKKDFKV